MYEHSHRLFRAAALGAALLSGIFAYAPAVFAQVSEGLTIRPSVINERVEPGSTYEFSIRATNESQTARTLYLAAQDISGLSDQGVPVFSEEGERTPYELSSWLSLPQGAIEFGPGETREIPFTVRVPAEASPGGHFGGIFLDAQPPRLRTVGAGVAVRVATIMNLRVAGEAHEEARIREFSTDRAVYNLPQVSFLARAENLGNVLLRPQGFIKVTDMRGREVATVNVNENAGAVFPGEERRFTAMWEHDGFAFGRYQATLAIAYGEDARRSLTSTASFWVLPLKPLAVTLGGLLGALLLLYFIVQMYIRRKLREMGVSRSSRASAELYARKYRGPVSRLMLIAVAIVLFILLFLLGLFFVFA